MRTTGSRDSLYLDYDFPVRASRARVSVPSNLLIKDRH